MAASDARGTPALIGGEAGQDFELRKKVLRDNPELGALHKDLVMTGQITEAEFWDGREVSNTVKADFHRPDPIHSICFSHKPPPTVRRKASQVKLLTRDQKPSKVEKSRFA